MPDAPEEAQHHLEEHGAGHDGEDQPADMAERVVGALPGIGGAVCARGAVSLAGHGAT